MTATRLFHVSDRPGIEVFEPRLPPTPSPSVRSPVVWAVDGAHLANYLVPRDCPRVAFGPAPDSSAQDRERFIGPGGAQRVVAIESSWFARAADGALWACELAPGPFRCVDVNAGYFVSTLGVQPVACRHLEQSLAALVADGTELRVVPNLSALADAVARSSLAFFFASACAMRSPNRSLSHEPIFARRR